LQRKIVKRSARLRFSHRLISDPFGATFQGASTKARDGFISTHDLVRNVYSFSWIIRQSAQFGRRPGPGKKAARASFEWEMGRA